MFDVKEFEAIVMQHSKPLHRYCYLKLSCDKELCEETVNDIFRILYTKWDALYKGENIKAYLYRTADLCIKNAKRKKSRYYSRNLSLEEKFEQGDLDLAVYNDEYFTQSEEKEKISEITKDLSKKEKELFILRYIEKKTLNEIADITRTPYSTVRLRLERIEAKLKKQSKYK